MILIEEQDKEKCCACTACATICPQNAIDMVEDEEGFLYPKVNQKKCVNCGLCEKTCPIINKKVKETVKKSFAVQHKNENILRQSTSGGAVVAIAKYVLDNTGYVFGAGFDKEFELKHIKINNIDEIHKIQGSKYIQSNLNKTFIEIKSLLEKGEYVLFVGTPCQISGLKNYLNKEYEKLILIDFVCRSVPSPKLWRKYLDFLEDRYKSKVNYVKFRDKTYGYHNSTLTIGFTNGKYYKGSNRICLYGKLFHSDKISRPSCYNCAFKGIERNSDFTIFDSYYAEKLNPNAKDNNKGYSNILIHSKKGIDIFDKIKDKTNFFEINYKEAVSYTGGMAEKSIIKPKERDKIFEDLNTLSFKTFNKKYDTSSKIDYLLEYSKVFLYRTGLLKRLKKQRGKNGKK